MKSLLISIRPQWCAKIMNGDKTIEVRKGTALYKAIQKLIDEYAYADIYVYCTKGKDLLVFGDSPFKEEKEYCIAKDNIALNGDKLPILNGKVIFKFRCYKVEEIKKFPLSFKDYSLYRTSTLDFDDFEKKSCLNKKELNDYLQDKIGTAIHISNLEIFDKPKELSEFKVYCEYTPDCLTARCRKCPHLWTDDDNYCIRTLTTAPQSFAYIEVA